MKVLELRKLIREEIERVLKEGLTFDELATALDNGMPEGISGEDVQFSPDDDIIYVEVLSGPNKKVVLSAIQAILKKNPSYKIDPESKKRFPDGGMQFDIVAK